MTWTRSPQPTREQRIEARAARNAAQAETCLPRRVAVMGGTTTGPAPKPEQVESEAYRRLVAKLPCIHCCVVGYSQAAHPNTGKGAGMKTSDLDCFPLCADRPGVRGCHSRFDQGALFSKEKRREIEPEWGRQTRAAIVGLFGWPHGVPMKGDE